MKYKQTVYLCAITSDCDDGEVNYAFFTHNPGETSRWVSLDAFEIERELPDHESVTAAMVEKLRGEKVRVDAEAGAKKAQIDAQIQSLMALEMLV